MHIYQRYNTLEKHIENTPIILKLTNKLDLFNLYINLLIEV